MEPVKPSSTSVTRDDSKNANRAYLGGKAVAEKLTPEERRERAKHAADERWRRVSEEKIGIVRPGESGHRKTAGTDRVRLIAPWSGILSIGKISVPVYVLADGRRIVAKAAIPCLLYTSPSPRDS